MYLNFCQTASEIAPRRIAAIRPGGVGYPDPVNPATIKPRLPQEAVLHREAYDLDQQGPTIDRYNRVMADFYQQQAMQVAGDWSKHSIRRVLARDA